MNRIQDLNKELVSKVSSCGVNKENASVSKENQELRRKVEQLTHKLGDLKEQYEDLSETSRGFEEKARYLYGANETLHEIILKLMPDFM